jgi:hypothetical protein
VIRGFGREDFRVSVRTKILGIRIRGFRREDFRV